MTQQAKKSSRVQCKDPFAPVRLSPVRVNGSEVAHQAVEILNDQGIWQTIEVRSPHYQLIPNEAVLTATKDILAASDLSWREAGSTTWTGRFYSTSFISDGLIEVPSLNDTIAIGIRLSNSYNGCCQFRISLQAFVLSCMNGMISPRIFRSFAVRHSNGNEFCLDAAVRVISTGMSILEQLVPRVTALSKIPLDINTLSKVASEVRLPDRDWAHIVRDLNGVGLYSEFHRG